MDITGTWDALNNVVSNLLPPFNKLENWYTPAETLYGVSRAGHTELGGYTDWEVGDYVYCDGAQWFRIQNLADAPATPTSRGTVQPDNITTFVDGDGVISAVGSGGSGSKFLGDWSPTTNTPFLTNGVGIVGSYYNSTANGTCDFGAGSIAFTVGQQVEYVGNQWVNTGVVTTASGIVIPSTFNSQVAIVASGDNVTTAVEKLQGQLGGMLHTVVSNYTITESNKIVLIKAGGLVITLPPVNDIMPGYIFTIKVGGNFSANIAAQAGETIDGFSSYGISPFYSVGIFNDGFEWFII